MRLLFSFLFCLVITLSSAQRFSSEIFHEGFLVTTNKDTLQGELKYDLEANVVTMVVGEKAKTFSSHKIFFFEIFDKIFNNYRQFYSVPYNVNYDYKIPVLFEVVYEGKLSLLRREQIITQAVNNTAAYWGGGTVTQNVIKYSYYFLDDEGKITYFNGKKKELFRFMAKKQGEVKEFIKNNKLETDEMGDLIRITAFYNSI